MTVRTGDQHPSSHPCRCATEVGSMKDLVKTHE